MRDIVLALFIFGTIPFILQRPFLGLLVWGWLGYMNPHRLTYGFAYSFPWVMLIAVITLVSLAISRERKRIPLSAFSVFLFLFLACTAIATIYAADPPSATDKLEAFAKTLLMVYVTLMLVNDRRRMDWLVWMIVVSIGFYGLKGGVFTILRGGAHHVFGPPNSFIADNNALAMAFCMILPLMRYLQLQTANKRVRIGLGVAMFLTGVATLGTYSRGGFIALVLVSGALFIKGRRRFTLAIAVIAVGLVAYHFMPTRWIERMDTIQHAGQVNTLQTRIQSWEFGANVALHRPLVGGGFDVSNSLSMWAKYGPKGAEPRAIHSIYFRVLGEQGFPGLVLYLVLLFISWTCCTRVRRRAKDSPPDSWAYDLASMLQVSLLAFVVAGSAETLSYFDLSFQMMAMCALLNGVLAAKRSVPQGSDAASPALLRTPGDRSRALASGAAHGRSGG